MQKFGIALILLAIVACSGEKAEQTVAPPSKPAGPPPAVVSVSPPTPAEERYAENAMPDDPVLAEKYEFSCGACHTFSDSGAPITGHASAWEARINEKGIEGLLLSVKNGLNTMPANGTCADCSDDDLLALIKFMAAGP